ncbi:glycerate kinase [Demequina sp. NBRC 110056]|uniref:glycerate kinase n=1 Tax=Demequina sp. NBRC 110056 TaxID=1570345 RepID=UPI0009FCDAFC|nr:glycerate kinase [Demequina sp. NBRC 110056]
MRIVLAPDSFKGTASAEDAAAALAAGWRSVDPTVDVVVRAMADGGEGTIDALAAAPGAARHATEVSGPDGRPVTAAWVTLPEGGLTTAVIELAQSSGITLMDPLAALDAHTLGLGQVVLAALEDGAQRLLIAVGGSASTDGGTGALRALGAQFSDVEGAPLPLGARGLESVARVSLDGLVPLPTGGVTVLTDVTNPLTGPSGAAAVYGPQKGASPEDVPRMDAALARLAHVVTSQVPDRAPDPTAPGAGAAGGTAYGLALWGATLAHGASAVADAIDLDGALAGADLVITGEGRYDGQSGQGKVVSEVARRAGAAGVPVALVAGAIDAPTDGFAGAVSLTDLAGSGEAAMASTLEWLRAAGSQLAHRP